DLMNLLLGSESPQPHLITPDLAVTLDGGVGNDHEFVHVDENTWAGRDTFQLNGGTGADAFGFVICGSTVATGASLALNVDGGSGADAVAIHNEEGTVATGASESIVIAGSTGADTVGFIVIGGTVAAGATANLDIDTGLDPDTIYFNWDGGIV